MKQRIDVSWLISLVGGVLFVQGFATVVRSTQNTRDLPTFYPVDEGFYRGGQPTPVG